MDVLFHSRDADETSSAYNQRVRVQMCAAEMTAPPMGGTASTTHQWEQPIYQESTDSESDNEDPLGPSISRATQGSPPSEVEGVDDANIKQPSNYAD
jgi:hypothetical protein